MKTVPGLTAKAYQAHLGPPLAPHQALGTDAMAPTLALLATLLSLSGCHLQSYYGYNSNYGSSYGRGRETRDSYGTFYYDQ